MKRPPAAPALGRRAFLAATAAAGVAAGCSPRQAAERLVPWLAPPRDAVPGQPLWYRTTCRECPAGCGVTARTLDGRVVKLEGNPEDPIGGGALCARGQAAIQALYHPARFAGPQRRGAGGALAPVTWERAEEDLARAIAAAAARGPGRVRLVTRPEPGAAGVVQRAFLDGIGARPSDRAVLDPLDAAPIRAASAALLGVREVPVLDLSRARSVVAFGADLLETFGSPVEQARHLASGRGQVGDGRTRLTWIGPRLSLTGASADRWVRARAGGEVAVALGILKVLLDPATGARGLSPEAAALAPRAAALDPAALAARAGVAWAEIEAVGRELAVRRPSALAGPGPAAQGVDATRLAGLVALANHLLGNAGVTVLHGLSPADADPPSTAAELAALVRDLAAGAVDVLLVQNADLAGALPAALGAAAALGRVPLVASFASRPDATTARAHLVLPDHHALESFGDVSPRRGVRNALQPAMTPLGDTRPAPQVLLELSARLPASARPRWSGWRDLVAFRLADGEAAPGAARATLQRGGHWTDAAPSAPRLDVVAAAALLAPPPEAPARSPGALDLVPFPTALRAGGDLPWLREVPDALTSISWTPWLELSPATAARLGLATGDVTTVETAAGRADLAVYVFPGIRDDAAGLPLGGPEALAVLPWHVDPSSGALAAAGVAASVRPAGRRTALPLLEGSPYQHGQEIVPAVGAGSPAVARPRVGSGAAEPAHPDHRWAMVIDLDRCTGCQACDVACHAENNVPVMGPEAAAAGRYMGWIRIERYLGDEPGGALDVRLLPMLCQQCTAAPCEPVCPTYATYHTREGLNAQVYNRCIGTRYCSNNCPYKVRTFNWRDARFERPLELQLNPEVTVRSRGVMEKCTFCIQRIRRAEEHAKDEGRAVADGEVVPACAQTCPSRAIVFGDANDPEARVSRLAREPRGFAVLEELGTRPAITYLAPVREREGA